MLLQVGNGPLDGSSSFPLKTHASQFQSRLQATTRSYPVTCMDSSDGECEVAVPAPRQSESLKALHESWKLGTAPAKTSWANDMKHAMRCTRKNCVRCSYVNRSSELAKLSPMFTSDMLAKLTFSPDQVQLARSCWLASAIVDGKWGLGCIVCCATNSSAGVFASFSWRGSGTAKKLRKAKILKHGASAEHKRALAKYFNQEEILGAPPIEKMSEHLSLLMQGKVAGIGSKGSAMTWCLREALLDIDREFVRKAKTLSICRDDRALRLLMRFFGATDALIVRKGVLGVGTAHREGPDADALVAATKQVFEEFCTPRRNAPRHGTGPHDAISDIDRELLNHLCSIVEVIAVDEEAAELKAADIGRGRRKSALDLAPITPNLKFVTRDKAHGFRRTNLQTKRSENET